MSESIAESDLDRECFVMAPIGPDGSEARNRSDGVLSEIIEPAAADLDLKAVRADQIAEPGQITHKVIDHIMGARMAVADLTELNPNVFYELAVRHAARLPVVLIAEDGTELPFDIRPMNTIFFNSRELRQIGPTRRRLIQHMRNASTGDASDNPVGTSLDLSRLRSGDLVEQRLADLITVVEDMRVVHNKSLDVRERHARVQRVDIVLQHWTSLRQLLNANDAATMLGSDLERLEEPLVRLLREDIT